MQNTHLPSRRNRFAWSGPPPHLEWAEIEFALVDLDNLARLKVYLPLIWRLVRVRTRNAESVLPPPRHVGMRRRINSLAWCIPCSANLLDLARPVLRVLLLHVHYCRQRPFAHQRIAKQTERGKDTEDWSNDVFVHGALTATLSSPLRAWKGRM